MRKMLLLLLGGFVCLSFTPIATGQNQDLGTHELTGPVWVLWEALYPTTTADAQQPRYLVVSPDGSTVFVAGRTEDAFLTVAYDASTGEEHWSSRYGGSVTSVCALAVSPDGAMVFVTGTSDKDFVTIAYNATTGDVIWLAREWNVNQARAMAVSPDGETVFVTGWVFSESQYVTFAYRATNGIKRWVARYYGPANLNGADRPQAVAVSPDGARVFVAGRSASRFEWPRRDDDYLTVAYGTASGTQNWVRRYGSLAWTYDSPHGIAPSPDGQTVYVTGESESWYSGDLDYVTIAYDAATGETIWDSRRDGPAGSGDRALSLVVSPTRGTVFVTGVSTGLGTETDYLTLAYDAANGDEVWQARYDGSASSLDLASSMAVTPSGSIVFVTGKSRGLGSGDDCVTLAYNAETGDEIWRARYDGPAPSDDQGRAIGVSPDGGTVFMAGSSTGFDPGAGYVTIAYSLLLPISIDIKPENETNPIDPRAHGVTPVALLGSEEFDVTEVDVTTLRFGPGEAAPAHDLTETWPYSDPLRDVNSDGFTDLLVHFWTQESGIQCGDAEVTLKGQLADGCPFEGTDTIRTVGCSHKAQSKQGQE